MKGSTALSILGVVVVAPAVFHVLQDVCDVALFVISLRANTNVSANSAEAPQDPSYVALGSSFAAGPGVGEPVLNALGKSQGTLSYPNLLASKLGLSKDEYANSASSGALLSEISGTQLKYLSKNTKLVTLTAGGNDVFYTRDMLLSMLKAKMRSFVFRHLLSYIHSLDPVDLRPFNKLETDFDELYHAITSKAPNALIVVITYIQILPGCGSLDPLSEKETALLSEVAEKLRSVTISAARRNHFIAVDMAKASRDYHAKSHAPWSYGFDSNVPVHPNKAGHSAIADDVYATLVELNYIEAIKKNAT